MGSVLTGRPCWDTLSQSWERHSINLPFTKKMEVCMNKITVSKLFELYLDTLDKCGKDTRLLSDEMIEYNIFENLSLA